MRTTLVMTAASLLLAGIGNAAPAGTAGPARDAATLAHIAGLKRLQQQILLAPLERPRPDSDALESEEGEGIRFVAGPRPLAPPAAPELLALAPPNRRPSDPGGDETPGSTQAEVSVATWHGHMLAAWNDGELLGNHTGTIGWSFSSDGGRTWNDGGGPPLGTDVLSWSSDPVIAVDEVSGWFYLCALAIGSGPSNAIAVVRGRMLGTGFLWETPHLVRAVRDTVLDKPWIAVAPATGALHVAYTTFFLADGHPSDAIEYQRSGDGGFAWTSPSRVSDAAEGGLVQGARVAVHPDGRLLLLYRALDLDPVDEGLDRIRMRFSDDDGASFAPGVDVASVFTNFSSGAPGFNRGFGPSFPSLAVDRGDGPHRGRAYVAWNESLDFFDDPTGTLEDALEVEPNDGPGTAMPFRVGATIHGSVTSIADVDRYRFSGIAGRTVIVSVDSLPHPPPLGIQIVGPDGQSSLALSQPVTNVRARLLVFTLPFDGTYGLTISPMRDSLGAYSVRTGWAARDRERGRDHRDVFVAWSDDAVHWSTPVRVNDDAPRFDDWLPEIAVDAEGGVFVAWYDWRDAPAGAAGTSLLYMSRSDDGGAHWRRLGPVSSSPTVWDETSSNLIPNQGDYIGLTADSASAFPAWADGRRGTPDIFLSAWPIASEPPPFAIGTVEAESTVVRVVWAAQSEGLAVEVERSLDGRPWTSLGVRRADRGPRLVVEDSTVAPGVIARYRLRIETEHGLEAVSETIVPVPGGGAPRLALARVGGSPGAGPLLVTYQIARAAEAEIELVDVGGRRLERQALPATPSRGTVTFGAARSLPAGMYLIRIRQGAASLVLKTVVLR